MKQTIEIEIPDDKKAVWKDNNIVFEDINPQLPKTWEEFCKISNISEKEYYISDYNGITKVHRVRSYPVTRDPKRDCNVLPSKKAAKQHLALIQLHQLRDCYRQGWIPNCSNNNYIYNIYRDYNIVDEKYEYKIGKYMHTEYFLSFQSRDIADKFLINFRELIEEAEDLI